MNRSRLTTPLVVAAACAIAACGDDEPSTNTVGDSVTPTMAVDDTANVTGSTPVAAGDDSSVQENQPMQSSATD